MRKLSVKKMCLLAVLISFASILSYLDLLLSNLICNFIPFFSFLGIGVKLGFANIVIMIIIYNFNFYESLIAVLLKSTIVGLIFGGFLNFIIGLTGTIASFFVIELLKKVIDDNHMITFISAIGGFVHMFFQILIVFLIYSLRNIESDALFLYLFFDLLLGLISGLIIGLIVKPIIFKIKNN